MPKNITGHIGTSSFKNNAYSSDLTLTEKNTSTEVGCFAKLVTDRTIMDLIPHHHFSIAQPMPSDKGKSREVEYGKRNKAEKETGKRDKAEEETGKRDKAEKETGKRDKAEKENGQRGNAEEETGQRDKAEKETRIQTSNFNDFDEASVDHWVVDLEMQKNTAHSLEVLNHKQRADDHNLSHQFKTVASVHIGV
ncbi:hypothetical protein K7432_007764 [Basidiobolus ranarum]|uniref:Uncharacterized protein n=1 Tax=Basidiobolus ranarum TaxID=34480 RepID=A0ABR2VZM5_9FUNG